MIEPTTPTVGQSRVVALLGTGDVLDLNGDLPSTVGQREFLLTVVTHRFGGMQSDHVGQLVGGWDSWIVRAAEDGPSWLEKPSINAELVIEAIADTRSP